PVQIRYVTARATPTSPTRKRPFLGIRASALRPAGIPVEHRPPRARNHRFVLGRPDPEVPGFSRESSASGGAASSARRARVAGPAPGGAEGLSPTGQQPLTVGRIHAGLEHGRRG